VKLLLDENLSPLHARTMRELGYDALSVVDIGLSGAEDPAVRAAAIEQRRVLVTLDADFANVLRYPPAGTPGIVRLRLHPATEEAIDAMLWGAIPSLTDLDVSGKLVVVDDRRIGSAADEQRSRYSATAAATTACPNDTPPSFDGTAPCRNTSNPRSARITRLSRNQF
jgi:predicted nuclease of predicted toxin-antitoxin system